MGRLHIRVQPGARRDGFAGWYGELPKLAVAAAPVDDAANRAVVAFLARQLGVPERHVRVAVGARSRTKRVAVDGLDDDEIMARVIAINPRSSR
jgi:uncharacterized protein YggU (UPF0235/DUF167 family)